MSLNPNMGGEVRCDAESEEAQADSECTDDPAELDASLQHEEVEDAEDEHKHGCFGEERRAAPGSDDCQIEQRGLRFQSLGAALCCGLRLR